MAGNPYYGLDGAPTATFSMTSEDPAYPAINGNNRNPIDPLKATATSTVITMTFPSNITLDGILIANHNLVGSAATLSNLAGTPYSQALTIPARTADGQCTNIWRDTRTDSNRTDEVWKLTITGASANVAIGEIALVTSLVELPWRPGARFGEDHPDFAITTEMESILRYDSGIRIRWARGPLVLDTDRAVIYALWQALKGRNVPFVFVPDLAVNDGWYVHMERPTIEWARTAPGLSPHEFGVRELSMGLVL